MEMMIRNSGNSYGDATRRKINQLYTCVRYCENTFECRRTLQLEFFGEQFDGSKNCNKTCDNCRAGLVAEERNMSAVARELLGLLSSVNNQKNGRGTTLVSLTKLWRGSKEKALTKFLNTDSLVGYGAGSKYSIADADKIAHAMIFEDLLEEIPQGTASGFSADYVQPGTKANAFMSPNSQKQFIVRFAKKAAKSNNSKKETKKKDKDDKKPKAKQKNKKSKKSEEPIDLLQDSPDSGSGSSTGAGAKRKNEETVLPKEETEELLARIKRLVSIWADEEQMNGNNVFYWNIMSNIKMANVAAEAPTTMEELEDCELPQNVIKQYGERLVKNINSFIEQKKLQKYIDNRPKKKTKVEERNSGSNKPIVIDSDNEFDDIDDDELADLSLKQDQKKPAAKPDTIKSNASAKSKPADKKKGSKLKTKKPQRSSYF